MTAESPFGQETSSVADAADSDATTIADITVAILCGGKGTRLYPLTKSIPKALVPLGERTVIEDIILHCKSQGLTKFVLCEGVMAEQIQEHLGDGSRLGVSITHVVEQEPQGTGGALRDAKEHFTENVIVIQGDLLFRTNLQEFISFHNRKQADATLLAQHTTHPHDCDLFKVTPEWEITHIFRPAEGESFLNISNAGVMLLKKELFDLMPGGKINLEKDFLTSLLESQKLYAYYSNDYLQDMGTAERLEETTAIIAELGKPKPALFLDRDGVINYDTHHLHKKQDLELIPGSCETIAHANKQRIPVIVVTNQSIIARGMCTENDLHEIHDHLQYLLVSNGAYVNKIFYCPHHPEFSENNKLHYEQNSDSGALDTCDCRKPAPGMLLEAANNLNIDLRTSLLVGDKDTDILAGKQAGVTTILVKTGRVNYDSYTEIVPDYIVPSLQHVKPFINTHLQQN